jgi:glutathione synthase/RimK-type ligase-like ATP-grasp enzyme
MTQRTIAIATCAGLPDLDHDGPSLRAALTRVGIDAQPVVWDDPDVDWARFGLVVIRSTWDYIYKFEAMQAWLASIEDTVPLANPSEVVRWNIDKRYLATLQAAGLPVTPTWWPETPDDIPDLADFVVKPTVSAGCLDTARFQANQRDEAGALITSIQESGRTAMIQGYVPSVDEHGETALLFFGGQYSHAIRKGGMLTHDQGLEQGLFRPEDIQNRQATEAERKTAERILDAIPFDRSSLTYARVDLVLGEDGAPMVLELELFEPSVFLGHDDDAADRIAAAIAAHPALA